MLLYDSTDRGLFPADAQATAGYGGEHNEFQSYYWFVADHPNAHHLFIVCSVLDDGPDGHQDVALDIERGNAGPEDAVGWVRRQSARGVRRPILYAPLVLMQQVLRNLAGAGIALRAVRIWTSHPTGEQHRCTDARCGYGMPVDPVDATQCIWNPDGVNIDITLLADDFFDSAPVPTPTPPFETQEQDVVTVTLNRDGRLEWTAINPATGEVFHTWQTSPGGPLVGAQTGKRNCEWTSLGVPWGK
jgi:hypothetical protein